MSAVSFVDRVAIVTGAGAGIGRAEAIDLAKRGASVVVNDIGVDSDGRPRADHVVETITGFGGRAVASNVSITTEAGAKAIVQTALDEFGTLDILVNNAGTLLPGRFPELTAARLDETLDVHLRGPFFVTQAAWAVFQPKGYGRIVMTSSSAAMFTSISCSNYGAAKAGVYGLARALAYEGREHGILVNVVLPYAATAIRDSDPQKDAAERYAVDMARESLKHGAPLTPAGNGERGNPELVAALTSYLSSEECTFSGEAFSAWLGRYARVFVGMSEGWLSPHDVVSAEAIGEHMDRIRDTTEFDIPSSIFDENAKMVTRLAGLGAP